LQDITLSWVVLGGMVVGTASPPSTGGGVAPPFWRENILWKRTNAKLRGRAGRAHLPRRYPLWLTATHATRRPAAAP